MVGSQKHGEDTNQNPFMQSLRTGFEDLYRRAVERGESTVIVVPCAECIGADISQQFVEAHVLTAAPVPGCYMNLLGQGVEVKGSTVSTHLGFQEHRTCEVLQTENMFDYRNTFRVLVTDKPLIGRYNIVSGGGSAPAQKPGAAATTTESQTAGSSNVADGSCDWLDSAPPVHDELLSKVDRFRKTFVQVPGCEQSTAARIQEIVAEARQALSKHHKLGPGSQQRQLEYQVSRMVYTYLHSFIFPHLQQILIGAEERLQAAIRSYVTAEELIAEIPNATGRGLASVDVRTCSEKLALMEHRITPHDKITCVGEAHTSLLQCIEQGARASPWQRSYEGTMEVTGDDVLSLFILAVYATQVGTTEETKLQNILAHVAHVEMYSQGDAGRFEEGGYAVSVLQAALQFFLEEGRQAAPARGGYAAPRRAAGSIFASCLPGGGDLAAPGEGELRGFVRQARAQRR